MLSDSQLQRTIDRIRHMEQCLDEVLYAINTGAGTINANPSIREKIQELTDYYENGQWLQDYDCDTRGELPVDLKRGVLSQDLLYNLLSECGDRRKKKGRKWKE